MSSNPPTPTVIPDLSAFAPLASFIPIPAVGLAVALLLKFGPGAYTAFVGLIHNANPTKADYMALLKEIVDTPAYDEYAAQVGLPPLGAS
jgi:hypothetical protein